MVSKLQTVEDRLCGVVLILLVVLVGVCLVMMTWPLFLVLVLPKQPAECEVHRTVSVQGMSNCSQSWASCQSSCSSPAYICHQIYVQCRLSNNASLILPLFANVLGCGYDFGTTCSQFYETFTTSNESFRSHIYHNTEFAVPEGHNTEFDIFKYFVISLIPCGVLIICCVCLEKRKMFARGFKTAKKIVKVKSDGPRSFYQKKMLELEFKKNLRKLKMKNTQNDVKVFDLEEAQTTGALILKPNFSNFRAQPPRIIV